MMNQSKMNDPRLPDRMEHHFLSERTWPQRSGRFGPLANTVPNPLVKRILAESQYWESFALCLHLWDGML